MNKQIASELGIAEQTIKQHRGRVMRKLAVGSVAELVRLVERTSGQPWASGAASSRPAGGAPPAPGAGPQSPVVPT
jgi:hypothetical protein